MSWFSKKNEGEWNLRAVSLLCGMLLSLQCLWGCSYANMADDEAINTYQTRRPEMPANSVPLSGGTAAMLAINPAVLAMKPDELKNPIPLSAASAKRGKQNYVYYCIQCHGPDAEGYGTVGQSFNPLPANFRADKVQSQSDGELYFKITLGYRAHPPLGHTLSPDATWTVINYIRSLSGQQSGQPQG